MSDRKDSDLGGGEDGAVGGSDAGLDAGAGRLSDIAQSCVRCRGHGPRPVVGVQWMDELVVSSMGLLSPVAVRGTSFPSINR